MVAVLVPVGAEDEAEALLALADRGERLEAGGGERGLDDVDRPVALAVDAGLDSLGGDLGPVDVVGSAEAAPCPGVAPFVPFPYPLLASIPSLEAVLIAAFVLMKQNRIGIIADRRDHLDLQVDLLTEVGRPKLSGCSIA